MCYAGFGTSRFSEQHGRVERWSLIRIRRPSPRVCTGVLLGGSNIRGIDGRISSGSGETKVHEHQDVRQPRNALDETPGPIVRVGTPIRRFELPCMTSGVGALNRAASYAEPTSLPFLGSTPDMTCGSGAETSNVKDEPRPPLARLLRKQET